MNYDIRDDLRWPKNFDEASMTMTVTVCEEDEDGEEVEVEYALPMLYEVCPTCEGRGKHVNPNIDRGGLSSEDFDRDPGFRGSYFSGLYDVSCYSCKGRRVFPEVDRERADEAVVRQLDEDAIERGQDRLTMQREMGWH